MFRRHQEESLLSAYKGLKLWRRRQIDLILFRFIKCL